MPAQLNLRHRAIRCIALGRRARQRPAARRRRLHPPLGIVVPLGHGAVASALQRRVGRSASRAKHPPRPRLCEGRPPLGAELSHLGIDRRRRRRRRALLLLELWRHPRQLSRRSLPPPRPQPRLGCEFQRHARRARLLDQRPSAGLGAHVHVPVRTQTRHPRRLLPRVEACGGVQQVRGRGARGQAAEDDRRGLEPQPVGMRRTHRRPQLRRRSQPHTRVGRAVIRRSCACAVARRPLALHARPQHGGAEWRFLFQIGNAVGLGGKTGACGCVEALAGLGEESGHGPRPVEDEAGGRGVCGADADEHRPVLLPRRYLGQRIHRHARPQPARKQRAVEAGVLLGAHVGTQAQRPAQHGKTDLQGRWGGWGGVGWGVRGRR
eukprot:scaffold9270_cov93-Isochrysis_galbana.AAC.1